MSGWITDRLPTEKDADDIGRVWVCWKDGTVVPMLIHKFDVGLPWKPKEKKPQPYEPPRSKRREWKLTPVYENEMSSDETFNSHGYGEPLRSLAWPVGEINFDGYHVRQVLPGDIDPDEALAMRERMEHVAERLEVWADTSGMDSPRAFAAKLREAVHGH